MGSSGTSGLVGTAGAGVTFDPATVAVTVTNDVKIEV